MKAIQLILSQDRELIDILGVTAEMSLQSSIIALLLGVPIGIWLGACRFKGRNALLVVNRIVTIYPLQDVYVKDGVEYTDRYYVKKKNGSYALYDKKGNRMGYGGGFYDRFIGDLGSKRPYLLGICYEFQICSDVPGTDEDISADFIAVIPEETYGE